MRVLVDGRPLQTKDKTGIGVATLETIEAVAAQAPDLHLEVLFTGKDKVLNYAPKFKQPRISVTKVNFSNRLLALGSRSYLLPLEKLAAQKPDVVWFPGTAPGWTTLPTVMTIHDLSPWLTPEFYTLKDRLYLKLANLKARAKYADRLIAVSAATARDLTATWQIDPQKITVAPLGFDDQLFKSREQPADNSYRAAHDLNRPYFLALATLEPRKNLASLLEAYQLYRAQGGAEIALALVGTGGAGRKKLHQMLRHSPYKKDVIETGYVPRAHVGALVRGATALFFPSFYEGFGLPVLEGLACGVPVVASLIPAHSEVIGEAAKYNFLIDPFNTSDLLRAMQTLGSESAYWRELAQLHNPHQAATFSWQRTGAQVGQVLRTVDR